MRSATCTSNALICDNEALNLGWRYILHTELILQDVEENMGTSSRRDIELGTLFGNYLPKPGIALDFDPSDLVVVFADDSDCTAELSGIICWETTWNTILVVSNHPISCCFAVVFGFETSNRRGSDLHPVRRHLSGCDHIRRDVSVGSVSVLFNTASTGGEGVSSKSKDRHYREFGIYLGFRLNENNR